MVYSTVPITAVIDATPYAVVSFTCVAILILCCLLFIFEFIPTMIPITLMCLSIIIAFGSIGAKIYADTQANKLLVPQHKVHAKLIDLATENVKHGKNSTATVSVAVYEVENGDIVTFPIPFGTSVAKTAVLYVKD